MPSALLSHAEGCLKLEQESDDVLANSALNAANHSYAPYSENRSGVALMMNDGTIFTGSYAENAAFNPSLSPLQVALVNLVANGRSYSEIQRAVLVENFANGKVSQNDASRLLLQSIAPSVSLDYFEAH